MRMQQRNTEINTPTLIQKLDKTLIHHRWKRESL